MNLVEICNTFSTDDRCRELLERLRWPKGPGCPRCAQPVSRRLSPKLLWCGKCKYQFTVTANTIFHDSHLPLITWFAVVYLLCESRKGMSANQIKRMLDISYKTAWYLCHRIRAAMKQAQGLPLEGTVEVDETYVGGRKRGMGRGAHATGKAIVIGIRQRGGELRYFHAGDVTSGTLEKYIKENVSEAVDVILTDEFAAYEAALNKSPLFGDYRGKHRTVNHSKGEYVNVQDRAIHTNTVESAFSLLKRGIMGTWHRISPKHLAAYLDEMTFRFNRRADDDLFEQTLTVMVTADPLTFANLVK
jgi:transposase-like protein